MASKVVIVGGGFGGLYAARGLERLLPAQGANVTLVSEVNFMLYTPLLPGAAAGTLEPRHVVVPLREELRRTELHLAHVEGLDLEAGALQAHTLAGNEESLPFDHLVLCPGSVSRMMPVPGLAEHGVGFKTLSEAIWLRNELIGQLEMAETCDDGEERRARLTFVFVGGGYAGLEGIAELQDFASDVIQRYPRCRLEGMRWLLVEAADRIMPEIQASLAEFAARELGGRGIELHTGTTLDRVTEHSATLSSGEVVPTHTTVWTAGVSPNPLVHRLGLPLSGDGRIVVDPYLRVQGHDRIWALGDAAAVPDAAQRRRGPCPPTAQHALRQGRTVARNVAAALGTGEPRPFDYRSLGVFVDMGRNQAVARVAGIRLRGFPAWWLARTYHLVLMPGTKRRLRLLVDWTVGLIFGRDAAELGQIGHPPSLEHHLEQEQAAAAVAD